MERGLRPWSCTMRCVRCYANLASKVMKLVSSRFLMDFLQMLSELDETSLRQIAEDSPVRDDEMPGGAAMRVPVSSSGMRQAMDRYYPRVPARIWLALPVERSTATLLTFAKLGACNADDAEAPVVIPLSFLDEDTVAALRTEMRHQLDKFDASPTIPSSKSD